MKLLKSLVAGVLFFGMSMSAFADFSDVEQGDLYYKGIIYLQDQGIVNGYEDGSFRPAENVNRAEMMKILIEAKGVDAETLEEFADKTCFEDVAPNAWYIKYICYAKEQGYVSGYENGHFFRPDEPINLVEALKIVLKIWGIDYEENPVIWYKGIVDRAAQKNYIPFNVVSFNENLKRDQMADMIARIGKDDAGDLSEYLGRRAWLKASYATIQRAMSGEDWDFDPNHNALVLTTILTSQADDEKVFTVLDVPNELADDPSIRNLPKTWMYADEYYTYYYTSSAICILDGSCSESQLAKIDDILTEAWFISESFGLGEKEPAGEGCYYVSGFDFQMTFPESWGAIHDFTILDKEFWEGKFGYTDTESFVGQGVVCDGNVEDDEVDDEYVNDEPIRLQAK